jgi:hypothetical protein
MTINKIQGQNNELCSQFIELAPERSRIERERERERHSVSEKRVVLLWRRRSISGRDTQRSLFQSKMVAALFSFKISSASLVFPPKKIKQDHRVNKNTFCLAWILVESLSLSLSLEFSTIQVFVRIHRRSSP